MSSPERNRRLAFGVGILALGIAGSIAGAERPVLLTACLCIAVAGLMILMTALFTRQPLSTSWIRIDWFVPFLRKRSKKRPNRPIPGLHWLLPAFVRSDHERGRPGWIRRWLRWMGPSALSAPVRRLVQGVCFVLFLLLFFYVCWPYDAKPESAGSVSTGWQLKPFEIDDQRFEFEQLDRLDIELNEGEIWYVGEGAADPPKSIAAFRIKSRDETIVYAEPVESLTPDQLDTLLVGVGPWTFFEKEPGKWPSHYADRLVEKESVAADLFLVIDPLVAFSTAVAARSWVWSLTCAGIILLVCVLIPRGFCGYLCPLGTLIDVFDTLIGKRVTRFRAPETGWWVHIKYYLLTFTMVSALAGVLVSGYFAAIPVITRGMLFLGEPLQSGTMRGWHLVPEWNIGHFISIFLFLGVLGLGFFQPRFWCKYVCPSGATFSLANFFRATERKVESTCINCNKCVEICPFDAIKPDFTTRTADCTMCQSCGGVCPTHAIKFVDRWNVVELKVENDPPNNETSLGRRGFLSWAAGTSAAVCGGVALGIADQATASSVEQGSHLPVRPPGSVPEDEFLQMCIRCGECFKVCPNNVLQSQGLDKGWQGLWTPEVVADWAGCESSCNACGQVCPTGAIRALPLEEKRVARMGLAIVNESTCLPFANREACDLCVIECNAAGYEAIEYRQVHTQVDDEGLPIENSGYLAPVVLEDKCVGCGLCQTRCYAINKKEKGLLNESAIIIEAGEGKEDRLMSGSYAELRRKEADARQKQSQPTGGEFFVPETNGPKAKDDDPFGLGAPGGEGSPIEDKGTPKGLDLDKQKKDATGDDDPFGVGNN